MNQYSVKTKYWHQCDDGRVQCDLCPRFCKLKAGQQGLCFVRGNINDELVMTSYGRSSGFCIDPVEKKPLNHFYPGTPVLSFGTAGCNLACKFCQNWDISKSRETHDLTSDASPVALANAASRYHCYSVAYTYNDPVIFHEYAIDVAKACRQQGIFNIAVSAGYQCQQPRAEFYQWMDAANIDLKAFNEKFYYKLTGGHLQPVLDTLCYIARQTNVWLEVTTLVIPGHNDSAAEMRAQAEWMVENLGPQVPLHLSAFHPDWKMMDIAATTAATLIQLREVALDAGLYHVYVGNIHHPSASNTYCSQCQQCLIERDWYQLGLWSLDAKGRCCNCQTPLAGFFEATAGQWGARRLPILVE